MIQVQSDAIDKFTKAFITAQSKIKHAILDSKNPHFKSNYASLESVIQAVKPALNEAGITLHQSILKIDGEAIVMTQLTESSGQWIRSFTPIIMEKQTAQGQGSGITYARRYAIAAICCLGADDDDGNVASGLGPKPKEVAPKVVEESLDRSGGTGKDFVIPFGKNKGKKIGELDALALSNLLKFVKTEAAPNFREKSYTKEFVFWAETYLRKNAGNELDKAWRAEMSSKKNPIDDLDKALGTNEPAKEDLAPPPDFYNQPALDWGDYDRPEPQY